MGQHQNTPVSTILTRCVHLGFPLALLLAALPGLAGAVEDFTIAIVSDTQHQVDLLNHNDWDPNSNDPNDRHYPDPDPNTVDPNNLYTVPLQYPEAYFAFKLMIDWLIDPNNPEPVQLVLHVGDATQHDGPPGAPSNTTIAEWKVFNFQWKRLDGVVPYVIARGNHDQEGEFKEHYGDPNVPHEDASAAIVTLGGQEVLALAIALPCAPWDSQIAWAQAQLEANPDKPAIIVSHMITNGAGYHVENPPTAESLASPVDGGGEACPNMKFMAEFDPNNPLRDPNRSPKNIWDQLVVPHADQVLLTASGHFTGSGCLTYDADERQCKGRPAIHYHGFKAVRDVNGYAIVDTFQQFQGTHVKPRRRGIPNDPNSGFLPYGSHKGFLTLVRFRNQSDPNTATVEVLSWDAVQALHGGDPTDPNDAGFSFYTWDPNYQKSDYEGHMWLPEQPFWFKIRDSDGDGKLDPEDNCPFVVQSASERTDTNGDGIGNRCQCGDVTGGGQLTSSDVTKVMDALENGDFPEQATDRWDLASVSDGAEPNGTPHAGTTFPPFVLSYADQEALGNHVVDPNNHPVTELQRCLPGVWEALAETDVDWDGVPDPSTGNPDNCVGYENPQQTDTDGDGRGDVCTCGDANGNGTFERCLDPGYATDPNDPDFCLPDPNSAGACDDVWMCERFYVSGPPEIWEQDGPCDTDDSDTCTWTDLSRITGATDPSTFTCKGNAP